MKCSKCGCFLPKTLETRDNSTFCLDCSSKQNIYFVQESSVLVECEYFERQTLKSISLIEVSPGQEKCVEAPQLVQFEPEHIGMLTPPRKELLRDFATSRSRTFALRSNRLQLLSMFSVDISKEYVFINGCKLDLMRFERVPSLNAITISLIFVFRRRCRSLMLFSDIAPCCFSVSLMHLMPHF